MTSLSGLVDWEFGSFIIFKEGKLLSYICQKSRVSTTCFHSCTIEDVIREGICKETSVSLAMRTGLTWRKESST